MAEKAVRKGRRDIKLLSELNRGRGEWSRDWGGGKQEKGDQDLPREDDDEKGWRRYL